ncbi:MAG: hypothetical protein IKT38_00450 [Clostridia bacterium]|nr:hypothetical protein [Clostridia bacterium]
MKKSLLAIVLAIVLIATQFSMLLTVSAETTYTALTGRDDFVFGVNVRGNNAWKIYQNSYSTITDAKSLGSNIIRIKNESLDNAYIKGLSDITAQKDITLMLVDTKIHEYVNGVNVSEINVSAIKEYYSALAAALKGKIAYYQIGNEMDIESKISGKSGTKASHFNNSDTYAVGIYNAINAIKAVDANAKIVVNTSWIDVGFIEGIKNVSIDKTTGLVATSATAAENKTTASWDLNGIDWYSNGENEDFRNFEDWSDFGKVLNYDYVIEKLSQWNEDVIICEANLWPTEYKEDGSVNYMENADWLAEFVQYAYSQEKVKGFIAYELYDVEGIETEGTFDKEAHFGLIDKNKVRKDTFGVLQALYGGTDIVRAEIPDAPEFEKVGEVLGDLYSGQPMTSTVGKLNTDSLIVIENIDKVNLTKDFADYTWKGLFEFDFYVEDAEAFKSAVKAIGSNLQVAFYSGSNARVASGLPLDKIKNDGWNHIVLAINNFYQGNDAAFTAIDTVLVNLDNTSKTKINAASGIKIAIDNVCGTKLVKEPESTVGKPISTQFPYTNAIGMYAQNTGDRVNLLNYPVNKKNVATLNLDSYMTSTDPDRNSISKSNRLYIEFDFYVDNYEAFKHEVTNNSVKFDFMLSSNASSIEANFLKYNFANQVCKDGWNHIVLEFYYAASYDAARPYQSSSFDAKSVKSYGIMIWPLTKSASFAKYTFAMTNVIFTKYDAAVNTAEGIVLSSLTTTNGKLREFTNRSGGNSSFDSTGKVYGAENLGDFDFSGADNIEFDIFIENYALLNNEIKANDLELVLKLNSDSVLRETTSLEVSFWDKITQPGWNHIVIPVSEWTKSEVAPDMTSISSYRLTFKGVSGTNGYGLWANSTTPGTLLGIFNIQATKNFVSPEKLMNEYTSIGPDSRIEFNVEGGAFTTELENTADISASKMIEMDIFVENIANVSGETSFLLLDSESRFAAFDITSLLIADGWNHIQFDIEDLLLAAEDGFDLTAIATFGIMNENDFSGYIANLYAADYVVGDANRDGEFDIMDLIRVKKHSLEISNPTTNICAVDFDSDYVIGATDCTNTRKELLKK